MPKITSDVLYSLNYPLESDETTEKKYPFDRLKHIQPVQWSYPSMVNMNYPTHCAFVKSRNSRLRSITFDPWMVDIRTDTYLHCGFVIL